MKKIILLFVWVLGVLLSWITEAKYWALVKHEPTMFLNFITFIFFLGISLFVSTFLSKIEYRAELSVIISLIFWYILLIYWLYENYYILWICYILSLLWMVSRFDAPKWDRNLEFKWNEFFVYIIGWFISTYIIFQI